MPLNTLDNGMHVCFYMHAHARHGGQPVSDWLLGLARRLQLGGGSVFRASAGFGRHGVLHHEAFFELADNLPVKAEFLLREDQAATLLQAVRDAGVELVCACQPIRFGLLGKES